MIKKVLTVTEVNRFIKTLIDNQPVLRSVLIEGEISNFVWHRSGHYYFTIKDSEASMRCVMFKSAATKLQFLPENGMHVILTCAVQVYAKAGAYQAVVSNIHPVGAGALYKAYEQLKTRLEKAGWFDLKQALPTEIKEVGVITSPTGAAVQDMISVIHRRDPSIKIVLYPVKVQGEEAKDMIVKGIEFFNTKRPVDVLLVGRGGGSIEDLWAFNEESVASAIYDSEIPIVSAVGHESDFTIADYVADVRAATPSVAGELVSSDLVGKVAALSSVRDRLYQAIRGSLEAHYAQIAHAEHFLMQNTPENQIKDVQLTLDHAYTQLLKSIKQQLEENRRDLSYKQAQLERFNPQMILERGFAYVKSADGQWIQSRTAANNEDELQLHFKDGILRVKVL